jgi:hypothetical protein
MQSVPDQYVLTVLTFVIPNAGRDLSTFILGNDNPLLMKLAFLIRIPIDVVSNMLDPPAPSHPLHNPEWLPPSTQ